MSYLQIAVLGGAVQSVVQVVVSLVKVVIVMV